jgi:hypothetical protein
VVPIAVRVAPGIGCARKPIASIESTTASISRAVALGFITINISLESLGYFHGHRRILPWQKRKRNQRPVEKRSLSIAKLRAPT